jgi:phage shock protein A
VSSLYKRILRYNLLIGHNRDSLAQVRILENAQEASPLARWNPSKDLASAAAERAKLDEDNTSLRRRLTRLQVTVETLRLEMENMKASNANTARPLYYED